MFGFDIPCNPRDYVGGMYFGSLFETRSDSKRQPSSILGTGTREELRIQSQTRTRETSNQSSADPSQLIPVINFVGGVAVEVSPFEVHIEWPGAAPWVGVRRDVASGGVIDFDVMSALDIARRTGRCVVAMGAITFAPADREDVACAIDVKRRKRLACGDRAFARTKDDDFVDDVKLRVLRFLQSQLEVSGWARLVRWFKLPAIVPTDDELLANGPSYGGETLIDTVSQPDPHDTLTSGHASESNRRGYFR